MELRDEIFKSETEFLIQESIQLNQIYSDRKSEDQNSSSAVLEEPFEILIEDFQLNQLSKKIIVATYTAVKKYKNKILEPTFRRSIWEYKDEEWTNNKHRGVRII